MDITERVQKLHEIMRQNKVDVYIVPTADFHQSEYVGEYFKIREFLTGFTGSAGTAVFTANEAYLWTDGRYFIQAAKELEGTPVRLMKMGEPGVPDIEHFLNDSLPEGGVIAFDGRVENGTVVRFDFHHGFRIAVSDASDSDNRNLSGIPLESLQHGFGPGRDAAGCNADFDSFDLSHVISPSFCIHSKFSQAPCGRACRRHGR